MIITKMALPRRTFLRGVGASIALPLLDGMVPALTALQKTAAKPVPRLGFFYVPNGMYPGSFRPKGEGKTFEFSPILSPLAPYRDQVLPITGLSNYEASIGGGGPHTRAHSRPRAVTSALPCRRKRDSSSSRRTPTATCWRAAASVALSNSSKRRRAWRALSKNRTAARCLLSRTAARLSLPAIVLRRRTLAAA